MFYIIHLYCLHSDTLLIQNSYIGAVSCIYIKRHLAEIQINLTLSRR